MKRIGREVLVCCFAFVLSAGTTWAQGLLTNGVPQSGAISGAGNTENWNYTANAGEHVTVAVAKVSGGASFEPRIEVLGPDGLALGSSFGQVAARLDLQSASSGTYTVTVSDAHQTGIGTYQLQIAKVPGSFTVPVGDEGGTLTNGANTSGAITLGDLDLWSISAQRGQRLVLQLAKTSGGALFTPLLQVFGPDGAAVGSDSGSLAAKVDLQAPVDGTYTVLISPLPPDGTGNYQLQLAQVPAPFVVPSGDEGGALPDGAVQNGTITVGDLDMWTFPASPGDRITLQLTKVSGGASFTPAMELIGPGGDLQSSAQDATSATIDTAIENAGSYTVIIADANKTGAGTYRLSLTRGTIGQPGANPLTNGATLTGAIASAGQTNSWTFTASFGNRIVLRVGKVSGTSFTPWIRLLNPAGTLIGSASGAAAAEIALTSTNTGTYTVLVSDASGAHNQTGGYRLSLAKPGGPVVVSPGDEGGSMTNGFSHTGTIDVGDLDVWTFAANSGDNIVVRMGELVSGSSLTPYLRLYGPDGVLLSSYGASGVAAEVSARATNSGTFTVIASDASSFYTGSGTYRLKLAKTGSPITVGTNDEGGALINGFMNTGTIDIGDLDVWNFTAEAGESIIIRMGELASGSSLTPYLRLYGPDGVLLSSYGASGVAAEVSARATNSGTFTVIASDASSFYTGSGTYRLKLAKTGSPITVGTNDEGGALINGFMNTGTIDIGDLDVWNFTAEAGESIIIRMGELVSGSSLTPYLRLYGPDGVLLSSYGASGVAAEVSARATNSGTFTVIASDASSFYTGSGTYRLKLAKTDSPIFIASGDEGGPMIGAGSYEGSLATGDLDIWSFTACVGDIVTLNASELATGSSLTPFLRLYGPDGALLKSVSGASTVQASLVATNSGSYSVVLADQSSFYTGNGTYRLTVNGLSDGLKMCPPQIFGTNARLTGIGGPAGTNFVLLTTTNVTTPSALWDPIETNQFNPFGLFSFTNRFSLSETQRFFRVKLP